MVGILLLGLAVTVVHRVLEPAGLSALAGSGVLRAAAVLLCSVAGVGAWLLRRLLFRSLTSIPFAVAILATLLASTALGTVVVQGEAGEEYVARYGAVLARFLVAWGLNDLFHTPWFNTYLALLTASLLLVAVRTRAWKVSRWGHLASHMGVVVILCGGLVGNLAGVTGSMELHEGETTYAIAAEEGGMFPLGFAVRLDRFQVEHFGSDPGDVKSFRSRLAILEGGREVLQGNVEVNHPLPYKGWLFYQANYSADDPTYSGFLAVKDPGLPWVFAGFVMIVAGAVFVFYIRPRLGGLTP